MQFVLHEIDNRVEQIGEQPCHEEWQQNAAEVIHEINHASDEERSDGPSDEFVECDFLL